MFTMSRIFISDCQKYFYGTRSINRKRFLYLHVKEYNTNPKQKLRNYIIQRYVDYIKTYEVVLEKRFPSAVKIYRVFVIGMKEFKNDLTKLFQIFKKVNIEGPESLKRKEMEIYHKIPKDMIKVAPVLVLASLPMGGFIFPIAYMFPKIFLSSHFWSLQQRSEFAMQEHRKKLLHYRPVFRCLQSHLRSIKDNPLHKKWSKILGEVGSGTQPCAESLIECKPLFEDSPYCLSNLHSNHLVPLLKVHNLHRGWRRRKRLLDMARVLHEMDMAIIKEGGVEILNQEEIKLICFLRGLNPINMKHSDIIEWLNIWLCVSQNLDDNSLSLLLHCPVILGYNQPSNWLLIYGRQ